jgi:hypothetical protein
MCGIKTKINFIYFSKLEVELVHEVEKPPNIGLRPPKPRCPFLLFNIIESPW